MIVTKKSKDIQYKWVRMYSSEVMVVVNILTISVVIKSKDTFELYFHICSLVIIIFGWRIEEGFSFNKLRIARWILFGMVPVKSSYKRKQLKLITLKSKVHRTPNLQLFNRCEIINVRYRYLMMIRAIIYCLISSL